MATLTLHAAGSAGPDEAWDRYARPARWTQWAPQITRVDTAAERIAAGVTGRVVGPAGVSVDFVVDEVDEVARTWAWTVRRLVVTLHLRHSVTAAGDGSATALIVRGPLPVVVAYAPIARYALGRLVRR